MVDRFIKWFYIVGQKRAEAEMRRMGYTKEYLEELTNKNLKDWV